MTLTPFLLQSQCHYCYSLGPSDAIWRCRSGSTLAHVMACCLTAPSHYLNQCWLIISKVHWHSYEGNLTLDVLAINHYYYLENHLSKFSFKSPRGQWVKLGTQGAKTSVTIVLYLIVHSICLYVSKCKLHTSTNSPSAKMHILLNSWNVCRPYPMWAWDIFSKTCMSSILFLFIPMGHSAIERWP